MLVTRLQSQIAHDLKWLPSWLSMVSNPSLHPLKVVEKTTLSMRVMMQFWPLLLLMIVADSKKWRLLPELIWMTMPWTVISLVELNTVREMWRQYQVILRQQVLILQPLRLPFIWGMIWPILPVTPGSVMWLLLTMRRIWTVQMVWVKFGWRKDVLQIVRQVLRQRLPFRWQAWLLWQRQIRVRLLRLCRPWTQKQLIVLSLIQSITMARWQLLIRMIRQIPWRCPCLIVTIASLFLIVRVNLWNSQHLQVRPWVQ